MPAKVQLILWDGGPWEPMDYSGTRSYVAAIGLLVLLYAIAA